MWSALRSLFQQLHSRKVFSSAFAYVVFAWVVLQVADVVFPIYEVPDWMLRMTSTLLLLGFPIVVILSWFFDFKLTGFTATGSGDATPERREGGRPAIELPDGPSIAVIPFRNLSGDKAQDLFAEALTADIVTGLTQSSHLFVLSAGAAATHAGPEPDVAAIGASLGVKYLLLGSVRTSGEALRVSAQLLDAENSVQLWSENYDRQLNAEALFAVQDDIRERIVATLGDLHGIIYSVQGKRGVHRPTSSLSAYECLAVALAYDKYLSAELHLRARESLEQAVEIDPDYDEAWSHLSWIYTDEWVWGFNPLPKPMERALAAAQRGIRLAPENYHNHWLMSRVHYFSGELAQFRAESTRALELNNADGTTLGLIGMYTAWSGDWEHGLDMMNKAKQLNPNYPNYYHVVSGSAEFFSKNFDRALQELLKANLPEFPLAQIFLGATYGKLGRDELAAKHFKILAEIGGPNSQESLRAYLNLSFPFLPDFVETVVYDFIPAQSGH
jgi:adenylate cyclase